MPFSTAWASFRMSSGRWWRRLHAFIDEMADAVVKPLDGMGGSQVFRVRRDDPNRNVIIETVTHDGRRTVMAQRGCLGS